jgi:hypothetical protein
MLGGNAHAATWLKVAETPGGTTYLDTSTIVQSGEMVSLTELVDLRKPATKRGITFASGTMQTAYHCGLKVRVIAQTVLYAGKMATGNVLRTENPPMAVTTADEPHVAPLLAIACKPRITL